MSKYLYWDMNLCHLNRLPIDQPIKRVRAVPIEKTVDVKFMIAFSIQYYIEKVYHSDTLLYQGQQNLVSISEPIFSLMMIRNNPS